MVLKNNREIVIALISDIHANKPALEAVLKDIKNKNAHYIWNAGDSVGYGPHPNEVLSILKAEKIPSILGNYDKMVLESCKNSSHLPQHPQKMFAAYWTFQMLSPENKAYLSKLPHQRKFNINKLRLLLVHGSPSSNKEYLDDKTDEKRLEYFAKTAKADIIISGHSHRPSYRYVKSTHFINPGSVGRPDDGNPAASYAILRISNGNIKVEHFRIPYNVSQTVSAIRSKKLPTAFEKMFREGINFEVATTRCFDGAKEMSISELKQAEKSVYGVLKKYSEADLSHSEQVMKLCLRLFNILANKNNFSEREALLLKYAALLHDIGWSINNFPHHKASMVLILNEKQLKLAPLERSFVALIARYHRKSEPSLADPLFRKLSIKQQNIVLMLSAILRVADALDASHNSIVKDVSIKERRKSCMIFLTSSSILPSDEKGALRKKKGLLEKLIKKKLYFRTQSVG